MLYENIIHTLIFALYLAVPFYVFVTFYFGGSSARKSLLFLLLTALWQYAVFIFAKNLASEIITFLDLSILLLFVSLPPILVCYDRRFLSFRLSELFLVGFQVFRIIGVVFIIEMTLGNLPIFFALFAGIGDVSVSLIALSTLVTGLLKGKLVLNMIYLLGIFGLSHMFISFSIGLLSAPTPVQIFSIGEQFIFGYPLSLIPIFFLPLAICYHSLSLYVVYARIKR